MHRERFDNSDQESSNMDKESSQQSENKNSFSISSGSCNSIEDEVVSFSEQSSNKFSPNESHSFSSPKSTPFQKNQMDSSPITISNSNSIGENYSDMKQSCFSSSYDDFVKSECISKQVSSQQATKQPLELDEEKNQSEITKNGNKHVNSQKRIDYDNYSNLKLINFQVKRKSSQILEKMQQDSQDKFMTTSQGNEDILNQKEDEEVTNNMKQLERLEFERIQLQKLILLKQNSLLNNMQSNPKHKSADDISMTPGSVGNSDKQNNQKQNIQKKKVKTLSVLRKSEKDNKETKKILSQEQTQIHIKNGKKTGSKSVNKITPKAKEKVKKPKNVSYELDLKDSSEDINNTSNQRGKDIVLAKKDLDEKFQMQLEDIHYRYHLKILKLSDRLVETEAENAALKQQLNDVKQQNLQVTSKMIYTAQDLRYGILIAEEMGVNSLEEVFQKLKILQDNKSQEKRFISCITDLVSRCTSNIGNQDTSSGLQDFDATGGQIKRNNSLRKQKQFYEEDNRMNGMEQVNENISENDRNTKTNEVSLKQAWKWLKFIMEDYVVLKSHNHTDIQSNHKNSNTPKNNTLFQSCQVNSGHSMESAPHQSQLMYQKQLQNSEDSKLLSLVKKIMNIELNSDIISALQDLLQENQRIKRTLCDPNQKINHTQQKQIQQEALSRYQSMNSLAREISPYGKNCQNENNLQLFMPHFYSSVGSINQPKSKRRK